MLKNGVQTTNFSRKTSKLLKRKYLMNKKIKNISFYYEILMLNLLN